MGVKYSKEAANSLLLDIKNNNTLLKMVGKGLANAKITPKWNDKKQRSYIETINETLKSTAYALKNQVEYDIQIRKALAKLESE